MPRSSATAVQSEARLTGEKEHKDNPAALSLSL